MVCVCAYLYRLFSYVGRVYTIPQGLGIDNGKTEIKRFIHLLVYIVVPANANPRSQKFNTKISSYVVTRPES